MVLVLLAYLLHGLYHVWNMPTNDMERSYLDLDHEEMQRRWSREFGGVIPQRMPFRLPMEYWLYAWARHKRWGLRAGRLLALGIGGAGVALAMGYAQALSGPIAGLLAGCILISNPIVIRALVSATYVPWVASLWTLGLWALAANQWQIAMACGVLLAMLRATSWGMALWLLWASGGIVLASGLAAYLWLKHPDVVRAQGWWRVLRGEACPVKGLPRDGWGYALQIGGQRFEAWGAWLLAAIVLGHWEKPALGLLAVTLAVLVATHAPRAMIRPKWVLGYLPDYALPVAVAIGVTLTS